MKVSEFTKKLNYVEGKSYTIEEHISMPEGGVYEDYLEHDNIKEGSLTVYTGPQLTGGVCTDLCPVNAKSYPVEKDYPHLHESAGGVCLLCDQW